MPPSPAPARVYLYGMIVLSTIHRLEGEYPAADGYGEVVESHVVPGGETGNSALVLARWGHRVKVAGPFLGTETAGPVVAFLEKRGIDCAALQADPTFPGVQDRVFVGGKTRTVFGQFGGYFRGPKRWSVPARPDIAAADIVGLDPFFGEESVAVAQLCAELGRPYVTIDCAPDSVLHRSAAATVVSAEYLRNTYPAADRRKLLRMYATSGPGLVIFTFGADEILFARGSGEIGRVQPFRVVPKSTLGAGDTFRGGVIHGILNGFADEAVVRFAAATAACVCQRFPMAYDPPGIDEVLALAGSGTKA